MQRAMHEDGCLRAEVTLRSTLPPCANKHHFKVKRWKENWDEFAWPLFSTLGRVRLGPGGSNSGGSSGGGCGCGAGASAGGGGGDRGCGWRAGGIFSGAGGWSVVVLAESVVVPAVVLLILLVSVPWLSDALEGWAVEWAAMTDRWRRRQT